MSSKSQRTIRKNKRRDEKTHQRRDFVSPRTMTATRSASHREAHRRPTPNPSSVHMRAISAWRRAANVARLAHARLTLPPARSIRVRSPPSKTSDGAATRPSPPLAAARLRERRDPLSGVYPHLRRHARRVDLLGPMDIPADALYGIATARAMDSYHITGVKLKDSRVRRARAHQARVRHGQRKTRPPRPRDRARHRGRVRRADRLRRPPRPWST